MTIKIYEDLEQGSESWYRVRTGVLTASEVKNVITNKLKIADNANTKTHLYELGGQVVTNFVEPTFVNDHMLRGNEDEIEAKILYAKHYAEVKEVGFITNDKWGYKLGFSPDGLVGDDGFLECKSRLQKYQYKTIIENKVPEEYMLQIQTGFLVSERKWCDFISYCGGMPMIVIRVYPDEEYMNAIIRAASGFHAKLNESLEIYKKRLEDKDIRLIPTERRLPPEEEMIT